MTHIKCKKCNGYGCNCYPINPSNKTMVVPRSGSSAFQAFLSYNPDYPYSEKYWVETDLKGEKGDLWRPTEDSLKWEKSTDGGSTWEITEYEAKGDKGDKLTYQDLTAQDIIDLSQSININAQRIPAVSAGALPTPTEPNSYMVVTGVGAYTYGGTTIGTNAEGYQTTFWWNGTAWSNNGSVKVKGDMPTLNNTTDSTSTSEASTANISRLLKLRELASSDWEVTIPATWTYDRVTGLLSQTGTLQIKLKSGNNLLIPAFTNLQVVESGIAPNGSSLLYIDFDTPSTINNIIGTISIASSANIPTLPDNKSRIVLGYSILITSTNADLYSEKLGLFYNIVGNKRPLQLIKESAESAISASNLNNTNINKLKLDLQSSSGFVTGTNDWVFNPTTGKLSAPTAKRYVNGNGYSIFLVTAEGAPNVLITNLQVAPTDGDISVPYVIYADVDSNQNGGTAIIQVGRITTMPNPAIGKQRIVIGIGKKITNIQYDLYSPLFGLYKENDNRKSDIQKAIEASTTPLPAVITNRMKVEEAWYNKFPNALSKCPKFVKKVLDQQEDVEILLLGDSLFALQSGASATPANPMGLPNGCYQQHVQYWLWNYIVKNKPLTNRWEVTPNVFSYSGTWSIVGGSKFDIPAWSGEFRSYVSTIHQSNTENASIGFTWNLADYEKLNWIYKKSLDGASIVTLNITEGNGKVQVFNGTSWVEANGYTFSQKTSYQGTDTSSNNGGGSGYSVHLSDQKIKMRRVASSGNVTITFSKGASTTEYLYFWGTERWNGATIFITNVARGGRYISLLQQNFMNDVVERKPDLVLFELPMTNEYSNFSQSGYAQILNHAQDFIWGDRAGATTSLSLKQQSNNWQDFECLLIMPHYRSDYWNGDKPMNYKLSGSNLDVITYDGDSTPYATNQKLKSMIRDKGDLNYIDMGDVFIAEAKNLGWTIQQATTPSGMTSENSFTNDTVHQNDFGSYVWAKVLGGVLGNV